MLEKKTPKVNPAMLSPFYRALLSGAKQNNNSNRSYNKSNSKKKSSMKKAKSNKTSSKFSHTPSKIKKLPPEPIKKSYQKGRDLASKSLKNGRDLSYSDKKKSSSKGISAPKITIKKAPAGRYTPRHISHRRGILDHIEKKVLETDPDDFDAIGITELPPPTKFKWEIPEDLTRKPVFIRHPHNPKKMIKLPPEEEEEYYHIVSWIEYYGKDYFEHGLYKVQKDIIAHFVHFRWVVDEVFRSAGKTFVAEFLLAYQIVEGNRNGRYFIVGEIKSKTIDRVMFCRNILSSRRIIRDYGFIIAQGGRKHKSKDRASSFNVIRTKEFVEATLTGLSWQDQTMQGAHYDGGIFDDVWSMKLQITQGAKEKFMNWYQSFQFTLEQCDWFVMLRTRKGVNDLYAVLDERHEWTKFTTPLVLKWPPKDSYEVVRDEETGRYNVVVKDKKAFADHELYDSCPTPMKRYGYKDPEDRSKGFNVGPKYTMQDCILLDFKDHVVFFREMQNQPFVPEGKLFKRKHLHIYDKENKAEDPLVDQFYIQQRIVQKIMIMDPAKGEVSDYNVLGLLGYYQDRYFLMDAWVWRGDPEERERIVRLAASKYPGVDLYIESDYDQFTIIKELRKRIRGLRILPFESKGKGQKYQDLYVNHPNSKKRAKMGKIHDALEFPWNHDQIYLHKNLPLLKEPDDSGGGYAATLLHQITTFPDCELFDYIDMLAMGVIVLREHGTQPLLGIAI